VHPPTPSWPGITYPPGVRDVIDAIRYLDRTSCQWRALPADFPPWPTVYHDFRTWTADGTLARMHDGLRAQVRQAQGRDREPTAAAADSQTVRAAETVARSSRGYDAGNYADRLVMPMKTRDRLQNRDFTLASSA